MVRSEGIDFGVAILSAFLGYRQSYKLAAGMGVVALPLPAMVEIAMFIANKNHANDQNSAKICKIISLDFLRRKYAYFGLAGAMVVLLCALVTALFYSAPAGEPYSLLNHFISELGEVGVSLLAWLFNLGLIAGSLLFIPFSLGLGLSLPGWLSKVGMGIFPMNNLPLRTLPPRCSTSVPGWQL